MNVYELRLDSTESDGTGMALVAADDYEGAVREYIANGDCGDDVRTGKVKFSPFSDIPISGLHYDGGTQVLCDCFCFCQDC